MPPSRRPHRDEALRRQPSHRCRVFRAVAGGEKDRVMAWYCKGPAPCKCTPDRGCCECEAGEARNSDDGSANCTACHARVYSDGENRSVLDAQLDAEPPEGEPERVPVLPGQKRLFE